MQTVDAAIESIIDAHPNLYLEHCIVMCVALMSKYSLSPCEFVVKCSGVQLPMLGENPTFRLRVAWEDSTAGKAQRMVETEQLKPMVERAAIALAALLFAKFIEDGEMRVTGYGESADYWLPRLQCALEISGTENLRYLSRRHQQKKEQVLHNPLGFDGYVVVCCVSARQKRILWTFQSKGELKNASFKSK